MPVQIIECDQNSAEWFEARRGIPTASKMSTILAKGKGAADSLTRTKYMRQLAGEIITEKPFVSYSNDDMKRGHEMEPAARDMYAFRFNVEPQLVGFIRNGDKGASPDSLIGEAGMLEIKTKQPDLLIEAMLREDFPPEHKAQCQAALWIAEREWIDIAIYWPDMPFVVYRAKRDQAYIMTMISAVKQFNEELQALVEKVRSYRTPQL